MVFGGPNNITITIIVIYCQISDASDIYAARYLTLLGWNYLRRTRAASKTEHVRRALRGVNFLQEANHVSMSVPAELLERSSCDNDINDKHNIHNYMYTRLSDKPVPMHRAPLRIW